MARNGKEQLFDCMITYGELDSGDPWWYNNYKKGTYRREVAKHNVTREEATAWYGSAECMKRVHELEDLGQEKFDKDHWMKWGVSYFWIIAAEDQPEV